MEQFRPQAKNIDYNEAICKVSIVGVGMKSNTGVASKAFTAMANENINIRIISTSEIKISMIIDEKYAELAVRALHDAYNWTNNLQEFLNWTVDTIREDKLLSPWLEEKKV